MTCRHRHWTITPTRSWVCVGLRSRHRSTGRSPASGSANSTPTSPGRTATVRDPACRLDARERDKLRASAGARGGPAPHPLPSNTSTVTLRSACLSVARAPPSSCRNAASVSKRQRELHLGRPGVVLVAPVAGHDVARCLSGSITGGNRRSRASARTRRGRVRANSPSRRPSPRRPRRGRHPRPRPWRRAGGRWARSVASSWGRRT
jgi:hypothetical protein